MTIQRWLRPRNGFALLMGLLIFAKLTPFYQVTVPMDTGLNGRPIHIDVDLLLVMFVTIAAAIFVRRGSNDCWFIAMNFVALILISIVLEWYQPGLGLSIFLLMMATSVFEELIFRFALFELLWRRFKPAMIVLISTVIFTLMHTNVYTHYDYSLMVLLTGWLLASVYLRFRRKEQIVMGVVVTSWLHLAVILLGFHFSLIPQ